MRKKNNTDLFDSISRFQRTILSNKPTTNQMYEEVRMMRFKIRPVSGEISQLDFNNTEFIEMLWGLGKMDEFFQSHINEFNDQEKHTFYRIFEDLHRKFQNKYNQLQIAKRNTHQASPSAFEMEIYKDRSGFIN